MRGRDNMAGPWEWFAFLCVCFALLLSLCRGFRLLLRPAAPEMLHILENEDETPRCARIRGGGVTSFPKLEPKHKVFLSHSGVQKGFVGKLCKRLEAHNHYPFFDQRPDSLPKGKKFAALIIDAAKTCQVAVVVLSEEYLSSKWPMIELAEFVRASKSGNKTLNLLPLFYKASVSDLDDKSIKVKWMPKWVKLAGVDPRVDLVKWAEAVRELRRVNGLDFHKFKSSESYRDAIVKGIFRLAPPDLLFDTSKIHGKERICEFLADKFQPDPRTSASVLGLYGMGGLGKTTISKCLCNHFNQEFLGRVCYIEMKEGMDALERQRMVMRKLLRLDELILQDICDASQGWDTLKNRMKQNPVFLVIDNVQPDEVSKEEALEYLNVEYNSQSKIMVVSRSLDVVESVVGDPRYCCEIPRLEREEAAGIFLQQGAPMLEYSSLNAKERRIVEGCLREAWFRDQDFTQTNVFGDRNEGGHYHPLAIRALGVYFHDKSETLGVSSWDTFLDEYRKLKGIGGSYDTLFKILGLQFITLDKMTQFMFLDIVLYALDALKLPLLSNSPLEDMISWLANICEVSAVVVKQKILYLKKCAMLNIEGGEIIVHDLYKEFATWFLESVVNSKELVGVCRVRRQFKDQDPNESNLPHGLQSSPGGTCWQELRRIRLENVSFHGFAVRKFQEWQNVVVLQISGCMGLTTLDLQGLTCIRHLELTDLWNLETLILTGDESNFHDTMSKPTCSEPKQCLPRPWLQIVILEGLSLLELLPSFSPFTSLKFLAIEYCERLTQPPRVQYCSGLKRMHLEWNSTQKTLPSLKGLTSLRDLTIHSNCSVSDLGEALKLEGLSSLISLGALELRNIPVGDLNGLEKLANVEYIYLSRLFHLADLSPLESLARSSLHVLQVFDYRSDRRLKGALDELEQVIKHKLEQLAAQGEIVPHIPSKIRTFSPTSRLLDAWFYTNRTYLDAVWRENTRAKEEEKNNKDKRGKGGGGGGSGEGGGKKKGGDNEGDDKEKGKDGNKEHDNKPENIELKVNLCCEACARKMQKKLEKLEGVEKGVVCDMYLGKVIVKATTKPEIVLKQAQRLKKGAVMWPQKKKEAQKELKFLDGESIPPEEGRRDMEGGEMKKDR